MTRIARALLAAVTVVLTGASPAVVTAEEPITREQAERLIEEIRLLRQTLEQLRAPQPTAAAPQPAPDENVKLDLRGAHVMGRVDAPITMVEFTDLECPFCRTFHTETFEQIKRAYIDTGTVRFISRDFPLPFHANARPAALAVRCAGAQGKFWEMRHAVTLNASALGRDIYINLARAAGLEMKQFESCVDADTYKAAIEQDLAAGVAAGVNGTPTFVIGATIPDGVEGQRIVGAHPYAVYETRIKELLAKP